MNEDALEKIAEALDKIVDGQPEIVERLDAIESALQGMNGFSGVNYVDGFKEMEKRVSERIQKKK